MIGLVIGAALAGLSLAAGPFSCRGLQTGLNSLPGATCSVYYLSCKPNAAIADKFSCPSGMLYNPASKRCNPPSQVRGCEHLRPRGQQTLSDDVPTYQQATAPQPRKSFRPQPPPPPPPPPRQFAPRSQPQKFVPRPQPQPFRPPPPPPPQFQPRPNPYGQPRNPPPPPPPSNPYGQRPSRPSVPANPPHPVFDCTTLDAGDYANGCSHIYYSCLGGTTLERECPMGGALKFDQESGACKMPAHVPACGGQPEQPKPEEKFPPVTKDARCEGKASGIFEMPGERCSSKFLSCNDGFGMEMECAAGMKFDVETAKCQGAVYVPACGGTPTPPPEPEKPEQQTPLDPSYTCEGLEDGDYPHPQLQCAYGYYSCVGGVPMARICPADNLFFDPAQGMCEVKKHNTACGGSPRQADVTTTHAPFVPESEFSCRGLEDGLYSDHYGCGSIFYACSGGSASKFTCTGDMVFDVDTKRCLAQNYVKACGGSPTPIPEIIDDAGTPLPPPDIEFDCSVGEGGHSLGCSHEYVVCSFGRPHRRTCATEALKYDAEAEMCTAAAYVKECGGQPTPAPQPEVFAQPTPVDFDCGSRPDDLYPDERDPCSGDFYTCSSGQATKISCPAGLVFADADKACLPSAKVPTCAGPPLTGGYGRPQPKRPQFQPRPQQKFIPRPNPSKFIPRPAPKPTQFNPRPQQKFIPRPNPSKFAPRPAPRPTQFQPRPQPQTFQPRPNPSKFAPRPKPAQFQPPPPPPPQRRGGY